MGFTQCVECSRQENGRTTCSRKRYNIFFICILNMIHRQCIMTSCQKATAAPCQLFSMKLNRQAKFGCYIEQRYDLLSAKSNRFTKAIHSIYQPLFMCLAQGRNTGFLYITFRRHILTRGHRMGPKKAGNNTHRSRCLDGPRCAQHP